MFRRRHRLHGPFVLYGGRIDPGKGCEELIEYFSTYVQEGGEASLVLMGVKLMPLPEEPFIRFAGRLSDQERLQALEAATVVVVPSPYESLSLLALEVIRGRHAGPRERAQRGARGSLPQEQRRALLRRPRRVHGMPEAAGRRPPAARVRWARNGRHYVRQNYRWDVIIGKYERMFSRLRQGKR